MVLMSGCKNTIDQTSSPIYVRSYTCATWSTEYMKPSVCSMYTAGFWTGWDWLYSALLGVAGVAVWGGTLHWGCCVWETEYVFPGKRMGFWVTVISTEAYASTHVCICIRYFPWPKLSVSYGIYGVVFMVFSSRLLSSASEDHQYHTGKIHQKGRAGIWLNGRHILMVFPDA